MNPEPKSEIILYQTEDNRTRIDVRLENETVWLSLNQMADLFQRDKSVISKYTPNPERVASRLRLVHSRRHAAIIGQDSRPYHLLHQRPPSLAARHRATERIAPLSGSHSQVLN